jgi:putative hydrolase of the HAD superfamily
VSAPTNLATGKRQVVWDFGGVLFHWQPSQLLRELLPHRVGNDEEARRLGAQIFESFTPNSDWANFDRGVIEPPALAERIAARTGLALADVARVIAAIPGHLQAIAASVALLAELRAAGHALFFLSNMPKPYARELERLNPFIAWFADGVFSGDCGLMKPEAPMFALADQRFGLRHAHTLFLDDHAGNIEAARAHGWQALQFVNAAQVRAELQALGLLAA